MLRSDDEGFAVYRQRGENGRGIVPRQVPPGELDNKIRVFRDGVLLEEVVEADLVIRKESFCGGLFRDARVGKNEVFCRKREQ